jgi:hypothetical protein
VTSSAIESRANASNYNRQKVKQLADLVIKIARYANLAPSALADLDALALQ